MSAANRVFPADLVRDRERILALWRMGLGHDGHHEEKFDWYYRHNAEGEPSVLFLAASGTAEPIGVASVGVRRMQRDGKPLTAGVLVDFVVDPTHRSFFPALALQRAMHVQALGRHELLLSTPNALSEAVVGRAGSRRIGELVRRARMVRSARYLARYVPAPAATLAGAVIDRARRLLAARVPRDGLDAEWIERPDARFDDLWARAAPRDLLIGVRDARFLAWRFSDCPLHRYRFLALTTGATRTLAGYAAVRLDETTLHVEDFLVDPSVAAASRRLWIELEREAWRAGVASASVEFFGTSRVHRDIEAAGWSVRSRRSFFVAVDAGEKLLPEEHWYFTTAVQDG